jgi:adenylyltransferase/sulfurtransferase|tara:strand:+ start:1382 stop:2134 length:753 start_codon:yes stop_codon:yes gene_type:complete
MIMMLSDQELLRYSRHIMLDDIDIVGQQQLKEAKVLLIGLGGLGSAVAMYLGASGIGNLVLVDDDKVDLSNLQRQIIHTTDDVGVAKVDSARASIAALNPHVEIECIPRRLAANELAEQILQADLVIDATDNLESRLAVNGACVAAKKPLISGAAIAWEGQVAVFDSRLESAACYQCIYTSSSEQNLSCAESGVVSPLLGVIGSAMALEALKVIVGIGATLAGKLMMFDAKAHQWQLLAVAKKDACPICR